MKTILLLTGLLLLAGTAGAGADVVKPPSYQIAITGIVESDGELVVTLTDTYGKRVTTQCEREMREAMRAMDPFIDPPEDGIVSDVQDIFKGAELWKQAKRVCWSSHDR